MAAAVLQQCPDLHAMTGMGIKFLLKVVILDPGTSGTPQAVCGPSHHLLWDFFSAFGRDFSAMFQMPC